MTNTPIKTKNSVGNKELIRIVFAAILAALAILVGYIEIVWPIAPHLKLDFSEVIVLASLVLIGFKHTIGVIVVRSVVRWLITGRTDVPFPFFGESIAIIASIALVVFFLLISKLLKISNKREEETETRSRGPYDIRYSGPGSLFAKEIALIAIVTVLMALFMTTINFFIVTPAYASKGSHVFFTTFVNSGEYGFNAVDGYVPYLIAMIVMYIPFNLIKFASCLFLFMLIKKPLISEINLRS
jgi:riboflavin transporter FmnP